MTKPEQIVTAETGAQRAFGYVNNVYADHCETHLDVDDRHTNRHGTLHGGLFSMILDSACGYAASRALSDDASQRVLTISFTVNYLASGRGKHVHAVGKVSKAGKSLVFCNGEMFDDDGTLIATGTGTFKALRPAAK